MSYYGMGGWYGQRRINERRGRQGGGGGAGGGGRAALGAAPPPPSEYEFDQNFDPASHPRYQQILASINAGGAADLANSRQAIQQALIAFGLVPEGFNDTLGALDENTRAMIGKNTQAGLSTHAQLLEARQEQIKELVNNLSARGLRRSGAKGAGLKKRQKSYDRAFSGAMQKLLSHANSIYGNYSQNQYARNAQMADMWWNVYDQYGWGPRKTSPGGGSGGRGGDNFRNPGEWRPGDRLPDDEARWF